MRAQSAAGRGARAEAQRHGARGGGGPVAHLIDWVRLCGVDARPACDDLRVPVAREDLVAARARVRSTQRILAVEGVHVRPARERVVAVATLEVILPGAGIESIVARAPEEPGVAAAARDRVVAAVAGQRGGALVSGDRVVAGAAEDGRDVGADVVVLAGRAVVRYAVEAEREVLGTARVQHRVAAAAADVGVGAL